MFQRLSLLKIAFFSSFALTTTSFTAAPPQEIQASNQAVLVDFRAVAKQAIPAVVSITVQGKSRSSSLFESDDSSDSFGSPFWEFFNIPRNKEQRVVGQGSGVIVSPDGYILTNSHVVSDMDQILVRLYDGREFSAKVLGADKNMDLALIQIEAKDLPFLKLGDSEKVEVGQWVAAIGNLFGLDATLTVGVVSAKGRNNLDIVRYEDFIQTDAAINRGNSGGALLDQEGQVIGINTAIATNTGASYMGVGFAIPSNMARYVMNEILSKGKVDHGFLGVTLQSIDYNLAQAFELKKVEGALVTSVKKGSPADKAGLQTEDIILKYNDRPVEKAASLRNAVYMMQPGSQVNLTLIRQGQTVQVPLVVGTQPAEETKVAAVETTHPSKLGIVIEDLTPEIAQALGYTNDKGVVVTKVQSGSAAAFVGLKKGALISSVNRKKVETKEQFYSAIKETPKGRPVLLQVKQGEQSVYVSLQVE